MILDILSLAENTNKVKVIDTDSVFVEIGEQENIKGAVNILEDYLNNCMVNFMEMHHMPYTSSIRMKFKNEFAIDKLIAFSKKRYIANAYNMESGKRETEIRGIEGRRASARFILDIVGHLQAYIENLEAVLNLQNIFYDIFNKLEDAFNTFNVNYISMPINPPKSFNDLKTIQSPARGMINFDILISNVFSKMHTKGMYFPILITEEDLLNSSDLRARCNRIISYYENMNSIKLERKKRDTDEKYILRYVKDLTIPEIMMNNKTMEDILGLGIKINYREILKVFFRKFLILFSPLLSYDDNFDFIQESKKVLLRVKENFILV